MNEYLVKTKDKTYIINADFYCVDDIQGGRKAIYEFRNHGGSFLAPNPTTVATFNASDVKAVIQQ